ncbi:hypothetical protein AURANDRAFT_72476, partial [Aureococcus anophagefferens]
MGSRALVLCTVILCCAGLRGAGGVTRTWTGATGEWADGSLWSPPGAPARGDDVVVAGGGNATLVVNASCVVASLALSSGSLELARGASLGVEASLAWSGGTVAGAGGVALLAGAVGTAGSAPPGECALGAALEVARGASLAVAGALWCRRGANVSVAGGLAVAGANASVAPAPSAFGFDGAAGAALRGDVDPALATPRGGAVDDARSAGAALAPVAGARYALAVAGDGAARGALARAGVPGAGGVAATYRSTARGVGLEACAAACEAAPWCASFDHGAAAGACALSELGAHVTESYGATADPGAAGGAEDLVPVCTLKHHPYKVEHVVLWARDAFQDLFFDRPRCLADALAAARAPGGLRAWARRLAAETRGGDSAAAAACARAADDAAALAASLGGGGGGDDCQGFAGALYGAFFADAAAALLEAHPPGALDGDGRPFWAGTRLPPTPAAALFDATDESDPAPAFLDATAALRRTSLGLAAPARAAAAATAAAAAARGFRGRGAAAAAPARLSD